MKTKMYKFRTVLIVVLTNLLISSSVFAQSPNKMSYQAVIRNSSDVLVTNTQVGMQISILQASIFGASVYVETQSPTTNVNGLVSIEIGSGNVLYGEFSSIDWSVGPYFIKTETDPTGGTNYTITGTSQLLSVPYALLAKTAESVSGGITETDPVFTEWDKDYDDLINTPDLSNYDQDATDDFDGDYNNLINPPDLSTYLTVEIDGDANNEIQDLQLVGNILTITNNGTATDIDLSAYLDDTDTDTHLTEAEVDAMADNNGYLTEYTETQTISDVAALDNSINTQLKNVTDPTEAQDAATKAYVDALLARIEALEVISNGFIDTRDGNHYDVAKIDNQVWMAENLAYLPSVNLVADGSEDVAGSYYYVYDYNGPVVADAKATTNYQTYGVLYNWTAAMNGSVSSTTNPSGVQGVCPTGWHLPSDAEWTQLTTYLEGESVAGGKLKKTGTTYWNSPNTGATNETGFTALPGGARDYDGTFGGIGNGIYLWSATEYDANYAWFRSLSSDNSNVGMSNYYKDSGFYIRCVRD